jgi:hypothetical protein
VKEGRDGRVRSVRLRTATKGKSLVRPVTQVCLMEAAQNEH